MNSVAVKTAPSKPVMVIQIMEPVSAVQWLKDGDHRAVVSGFTRWADLNDKAAYIHDAKESKLLGQRGKVNFGMIDGDTPVEQGDYVLTHSDGFLEVVRPAEYEALYRLATKAEIEAAAITADDSVKIVVLGKLDPELTPPTVSTTGETVAQRIKKLA